MNGSNVSTVTSVEGKTSGPGYYAIGATIDMIIMPM